MIKSYKIRIYPTKAQEQLIRKHIGCCRFIWNYMLAEQEARYKRGEKHMTAFDMNYLIKPLKKQEEYAWLNEVSTTSLMRACADLSRAYDSFFKKISRHPKFKSRKRSKASYPVREGPGFYIASDKYVHIEKLGRVKYKTDFELPIGRGAVKFSNPRIVNSNGKWMIGFGMECENQAPVLSDKTMGIDLGVKDLATVAFGDEQLVFHNTNKSKRMRALNKKLVHLQRSISRKYEANKQGNAYVKTNNIMRDEAKLRRMYAKIANIRHNYIHQTTHTLVARLPHRVVMEDLNVTGMMKNRHLSRAISEQCFAEFIRQMQYKCEWNGIEFIRADRFYPSSKTCSECGAIKRDLKLSERKYVCGECGAVIDRDYNAAVNLSRYAA